MTDSLEPIRILKPRVLLVEGPGDVGFFTSLLSAYNRTRIQIIPLGTESSLTATAAAALKIPGFETLEWLGVALDADNDAGAQYASAVHALQAIETFAVAIPAHGWSKSTPSTGQIGSSLLIFPDGTRSGDRERYIWERAHRLLPAASCIETSFQCLMGCGVDKSEDWKARVNSLLHALRPKSESRPNAERNGQLLFEITSEADYSDILRLIPADDEAV